MELRRITTKDIFGYIVVYYVDEQHRRQGEYTRYRPDGYTTCVGNYLDDRLQGKFTVYNRSGIISEETQYQNGKPLNATYYNKKGQKVREEKYFYPEEDKG